MMRYWLGVVSKEHVNLGLKAGIAQVCHGKKTPLSKMKQGDGLISPKISMDRLEKCQSFTAIGKIKTGEIYQVKMTEDFHPFRMDVEYFPSQEVPIACLLEKLEFTQKKNWGMQLRRGLFEISSYDYYVIAHCMQVNLWK